MTTFADIFTGGGGAALGARAAGLELAWGIEHDHEISEVCAHNLKHHIITADVLNVDPRRMEPVDFLHASPPCPSFSKAKTNGVETALDISLAEKVAEFVTVLLPSVFTLENVPAYCHSKSWAIIQAALYQHGYWLHIAVLNAADVGVPQSRKRLIVRAVRGGYVPQLPAAVPWVGWYEAIEDLIPDLPESQFAPWQLARLPEELTTALIGQGGYRSKVTRSEQSEPALTVTSNRNQNNLRAFLVSSGGSHFDSGVKQVAHFRADQPAMTVLTGTAGRSRAFVVDGKLNQNSSKITTRNGENRIFTVTTSHNTRDIKASLEQGRVVRMTPRALARFQSFPDSYLLPDKNTLSTKIIGNAFPPKLARTVFSGLKAVVS